MAGHIEMTANQQELDQDVSIAFVMGSCSLVVVAVSTWMPWTWDFHAGNRYGIGGIGLAAFCVAAAWSAYSGAAFLRGKHFRNAIFFGGLVSAALLLWVAFLFLDIWTYDKYPGLLSVGMGLYVAMAGAGVAVLAYSYAAFRLMPAVYFMTLGLLTWAGLNGMYLLTAGYADRVAESLWQMQPYR